MTAPSRADVGAMANILKAMKGDKTSLRESTEAQTQGGEVDLSPGVKKSDIKAMENIMKNFSSATSNVAKKIATTINESKKTEKGVQVGIYSVEKTSDEAIIFYGICFVLFRFFDIAKPFPVNYFDRNFKNSFGVIMDDVCAGFYVVLSLICFMVLTTYLI